MKKIFELKNLEKIYMIIINHCKNLTSRKSHMIKEMEKINCKNYIFNENLDACEIVDNIENYYQFNENKAIYKASKTLNIIPNRLKTTEISLILKNIISLNMFMQTNNEYCLILEDDVLFKDNSSILDIKNIINLAPKNWGLIFIGGFEYEFNNFITEFTIDKYHKAKNPATNGACAIIYNKKSAEIILKELNNKFDLPYDWELNYIIENNMINVYHYEYICKQLSKTIFESSLI